MKKLLEVSFVFVITLLACLTGFAQEKGYQEGVYQFGTNGFYLVGWYPNKISGVLIASDLPVSSFFFEETGSAGSAMEISINLGMSTAGRMQKPVVLQIDNKRTIICTISETNIIICAHKLIAHDAAMDLQKKFQASGDLAALRDELKRLED